MDTSYHIPCKSQEEKSKQCVKTKVYKRSRGPRDSLSPQKRFLHRPEYYIKNMTRAENAVTGVMIEFCSQYQFVCPSQQTIGNHAGVCRDTVSVSLKKIERLGLVSNDYRHFKTSRYRIADIFWDKNFIRKFQKHLPELSLLLDTNPTQYSNKINYISLIRKSSLSPVLYTKYGTKKTGQDFFYKKGKFMSQNSADVRKAVEAITEIELTAVGKARLAVFPVEAIMYAHRQLKDFIAKQENIRDPFALILSACKKYSPHIDASFANPLLQRMQRKLGLSFLDEPALTPNVDKTKTIQKHKTVHYDQKALARKAKKIQDRYSQTRVSETYSARPNRGDPITAEQIDAYSRRTTGRPYEYPKRTPFTGKTPVTRHNPDAYETQAARSLSAICDDWAEKWLITRKKLGKHHAVLNKDLAKRSMLNMISYHIDLYRVHDLETAINYLNTIIYDSTAPQSITRGIIISENDYYLFLTDTLEEFKNEQRSRRGNASDSSNHPRPTNTFEETPYE